MSSNEAVSGRMGARRLPMSYLAAAAALLLTAPASPGAWMDNAWRYRREVNLDWPANASGEELAQAEIFTLGLTQKDEGIRVAADDGKPVPARLLMTGPGDHVRVLFAPAKGTSRYYIYFGNPKAPAPPSTLDVPMRAGVLLEMRRFSGPLSGNFQQVERSWQRSTAVVGRMMVGRLFLGHNPFNDEVQVIARYSGSLRAPVDGEYTFAASASDKGALYIDGKPLLFVPANPGDVRFSAKVNLKAGRHELVFYHENMAGEQRVSVVWKRPNAANYELIPPDAFGKILKATSGPLQELGKQLVADMKIEYMGECFYSDHYSHRYRLSASVPPELEKANIRCEWDLGDGQSATGPRLDHVYLADGEYPIKLTLKFGLLADSRTNRLAVSRLHEQIENPPGDLPSAQSKVVATYDVAKVPPRSLPWAVLLLHRAKETAVMERMAMRLAGTQGVEPILAMTTLIAATDGLAAEGKFDAAARIWEAASSTRAYQPMAAKRYAELLLWRIGDFPKAVAALDPHLKAHPQDRALRRSYAQALILSGKPAEGARILEMMTAEGPPDQHGALSGAMARTIEYYITEGECEAGANAWEKWQQEYPADFLEGYSVLLQTQLMEKAKAPIAAAKVAEAFALAVPKSSYAPRLLDRAGKLLAATDPAKSKSLRNLLKQKYPEDPLSQDQPSK